jgi:hypothetical protein
VEQLLKLARQDLNRPIRALKWRMRLCLKFRTWSFTESRATILADSRDSYLYTERENNFGEMVDVTPGYHWRLDAKFGPGTYVQLTIAADGEPQLRQSDRRYPGTRQGWIRLMRDLREEWGLGWWLVAHWP